MLREIEREVKEMPTLVPQNKWVSVEERLPELPDASWCSRSIIVCDKDSNVAPLLWARAQVRGKTVERWKYHWGRIYDGPEIAHWMPLPEPPGKDNNVPTKEQNEPLTLDELLDLNSTPLWVVDKTINRSEWCYWENGLAYSCEDYPEHYDPDDYGQWLAYRRPPEGEEDT